LPSNGSHTTLAAAMNDAVAGQTIFLRDSVTESVTLKAGVNIASWTGGSLNTPTISGTLSMTTAGTCNISGIRLVSNGAQVLSVTDAAASIVNLTDCYLSIASNPGITFSSTSVDAKITMTDCNGDISAAATAIYADSSAGNLTLRSCTFTNTGNSTTPSTSSAGLTTMFNCRFDSAFLFTTPSSIDINNCNFFVNALNITPLTVFNGFLRYSQFSSGTASAISISGTLVTQCNVIDSSSATFAITGTGALVGNLNIFQGSNTLIDSTLTKFLEVVGISNLWTPNLQISALDTGITYATRKGGYTLIGNVVNIWGEVQLTSKGANAGVVSISNLPFATGPTGQQGIVIAGFNELAKPLYTTLSLSFDTSSARANFTAAGTGVPFTFIVGADILNNFRIIFSGFYIIQ
jgi:hypothetical protein